MSRQPAADFGRVSHSPPASSRRSWSIGASTRRAGPSVPRVHRQNGLQPWLHVSRCSCHERSRVSPTRSTSRPRSSPCRAPVRMAAAHLLPSRSSVACRTMRPASSVLSDASAGLAFLGGFVRRATLRCTYPSRCACASAAESTRYACRAVAPERPLARTAALMVRTWAAVRSSRGTAPIAGTMCSRIALNMSPRSLVQGQPSRSPRTSTAPTRLCWRWVRAAVPAAGSAVAAGVRGQLPRLMRRPACVGTRRGPCCGQSAVVGCRRRYAQVPRTPAST